MDRLVRDSGIPEEVLIGEFKQIHEKYGTSEYAFSIEALPSLRSKYGDVALANKFKGAIEDFRAARQSALRLYPEVLETLEAMKDKGCLLVGYTDSISYYSKYRVRNLGLDRVLDYLYSPPDHALPAGRVSKEIVLRRTTIRSLPSGEIKPNPKILRDIMDEVGATIERTAYVGNSLMKDVVMAQAAGVWDIWAKYGEVHIEEEYSLLKRVTHWPAETVQHEKQLSPEDVLPTNTLGRHFGEMLEICEPVAFKDMSFARMAVAIDVWKETVDVQQHFNDLELRIRSYAVTVLAAMLGLAAYGFKENLQIAIAGHKTSIATAILMTAVLPWLGFYLMDRAWYHRLLYGAVSHGKKIEDRWKNILPEITLTDSIGERSTIRIRNWELHSTGKMDIFYGAGVILLIVLSLISHFVVRPTPEKSGLSDPPVTEHSVVAPTTPSQSKPGDILKTAPPTAPTLNPASSNIESPPKPQRDSVKKEERTPNP